MLLALRLVAGNLLGKLARLFAWLCEDWLRLVVAGLAILSAVLWFRGNGLADERDKALEGLQAEKTAHEMTVEMYRAASAKALADAEANKARVETRYKVIENEQDAVIRDRLNDALSRLRAKTAADSSGSHAVGLSIDSGPAIDPAGTSPDAKLDDALICTTNSVKAEGWLDWYNQVKTVK